MYLSRQLYEEALYVQFYLTLLDTYLESDKERSEAFTAIENIPSIKQKGEFCFKWMDSINTLDTRLFRKKTSVYFKSCVFCSLY